MRHQKPEASRRIHRLKSKSVYLSLGKCWLGGFAVIAWSSFVCLEMARCILVFKHMMDSDDAQRSMRGLVLAMV